jgi:hypothetical protein
MFGPGRSQLAHKPLYGLIGIGETVFLHQSLVNALGAEPNLDLGHNHFGQRFTLTLSPKAVAGGRNGRFLLHQPLQSRWSKWLVLNPLISTFTGWF